MTTPVRDAATVVLLRDGATGLETWLLTRVRQMVFAPGVTVFPGGRTEPDDADVPWSDELAPALVARLGGDPTLARTLVAAAVRETFEETSVLLTQPVGRLDEDRADLEAGRVRFGELLRAHDLTVDASAVHPWSRWITPAGEVRRYDTRFFVAALPNGAEAADVTSEATGAGWWRPDDALAGHERGAHTLLPPTRTTMTDMSAYDTVADVLAASSTRSLDPVEPQLRRGPDGPYVLLPDGTTMGFTR